MIRVLVIDDSAVMRAFLSRVIGAQADMEFVAAVPDPLLATERIRRHAPDVVTLDVEMPGMSGLDFLRNLMAVKPLPVLMISSFTRQGAETTLRALELGAVDFIAKPDDFQALDGVASDIVEKIRMAAQARVVRRKGALPVAVAAAVVPAKPVRVAAPGGRTVIAIGASTGGVEALRTLLTVLPAEMPPILIAQHMLPGFTEAFARRLDQLCALRVKQAEDGEDALPGTVYVAPGGRHLLLAARGARLMVRVTEDPPVNRHRPSVDTLFRSVREAAGAGAVGVMLTGMGGDGAEALLALRDAGAHTIAQDEASSVVFGMPRQAIVLGAAVEVLPLGEMPRRLRELAAVPRVAAEAPPAPAAE